eukprot:12409155-Karenia_brevis.AAC.1
MGQNSAAYGTCLAPKGCLKRAGTPACSKTPSMCSDNDESIDMAFPPSDDEDACAAFLDEIGLGARQMSVSDSDDELPCSHYTKKSSQDVLQDRPSRAAISGLAISGSSVQKG